MADAVSKNELVPFEATGIPTLRSGALDYSTILKLGEAFAASGMWKDAIDAGVAAIKIIAGSEMGLEPVASMNGIDIIPGTNNRGPRMRPNADVQALLAARAGYSYRPVEHDESHCILDWFHEGKVIGRSKFSVDEAKRAGLVKDYGAWRTWPANMVLSRAITQGIKLFCRHVLAGTVGGMPIVTTDELDEEAVDPRDDLMRALFASLPPELKSDRDERLAWASATLGREVRSFNGPGFEDELSRADVQALLDAAEDTTMFAPEPGVVSPGPTQPSGPGGSSGPDERSSGVAEGEAVAPEVQAGAQTEPPRPTPAPSRSHNKPESAKAAVERVREHQAVASETRHRVTEAAPSNWLASLPPEARVNILTHTSDDQEAAERIVRFFAKDMELSEEWSDERLAKLAAATWRSRG